MRNYSLETEPTEQVGPWLEPLLEETGLSFASRNHGVTHGCGHDFHTASMLGIALVLAAMHEHTALGGRIRIIFQPAEETMPGGALSCIDQGALDGVPSILALHCDPRIEVGKIGTRIGPITSASDTIKIELSGRAISQGGCPQWRLGGVGADPSRLGTQRHPRSRRDEWHHALPGP